MAGDLGDEIQPWFVDSGWSGGRLVIGALQVMGELRGRLGWTGVAAGGTRVIGWARYLGGIGLGSR